MNRTEFLAVLALRLEDLPLDEREEAVKYYSEYLDEIGADGEESAIEDLGGAEKVSNIIRANCGFGPFRAAAKPVQGPELTLDGPGYSHAVEQTVQTTAAVAQAAAQQAQPCAPSAIDDAPTAAACSANTNVAPPTDAATAAARLAASAVNAVSGAGAAVYGAASNLFSDKAPDARDIYNSSSRARSTDNAANGVPAYATAAQQPYNPRNTRIVWIIILVVLFPLWIGLLSAIFGVVGGIFAALVSLIFAGFSMFLGGIIHAAVSIPLFFSFPATALATIGLSLLAAGIGALLGGGMLRAAGKMLPWMWSRVCSSIAWLRRKVSGKNV